MLACHPGAVADWPSQLRGSESWARGLNASTGVGNPFVSAVERRRSSVMAKKRLSATRLEGGDGSLLGDFA